MAISVLLKRTGQALTASFCVAASIATYADESHIRAVPFDAVELELAALWAR